MVRPMRTYLVFLIVAAQAATISSCKKGGPSSNAKPPADTTTPPPFDINSIEDTYADVASFADYAEWGPYNVHDPSIKKFGSTYYCYSTDVASDRKSTRLNSSHVRTSH